MRTNGKYFRGGAKQPAAKKIHRKITYREFPVFKLFSIITCI